MSADNGVYIGCFPKSEGVTEYRVIHAQNIEDVYYGDAETQDHWRVVYFGSAEPVDARDVAWKKACDLADTIDVLEYGVCEIQFDRPLIDKTVEEANRWLNAAMQP